MSVVAILALVKKYWPAVVAGLFLLYVLASAAQTGDTSHIAAAISAFLAAAGINQVAASAHATAAQALEQSAPPPPLKFRP